MESGYLVIRRQGDSKGIGMVCLVEEGSVVVQWSEGRQSRIRLPVPADITVVPVGSLLYRSLRDAPALRKEFKESPVSVLVTLLGELGGEASFKQLQNQARGMELASEHNSTWWSHMRKRLLAHPQVAEVKPGGPLRLLDQPVDPFSDDRALPARDALEALATPATKRAKGRQQALQQAAVTGASELTVYEHVAAHALGVALKSWPFDTDAYTPQGVSETVLAAAVEFLADVTKSQRRAHNPVADPSPKRSKPGAPPPQAVTPLLVALVTTPMESAAADQAAKLPRGLAAQACVIAVTAWFERADRPAGGEHLLRRGATLLPSALAESPLVNAEQRTAFEEELASQALELVLHRANPQQSADPLYEWADLVLGTVSEHTLRHVIAATTSEDLRVALQALPDGPNRGRERTARVMTSLSERLDDADQAAEPAGDSEQTPDVGVGREAQTPDEEPEQVSVDPQHRSPVASAPAVSAEAGSDADDDDAADTPESAAAVREFLEQERIRYEAALSQERGVAQALRSERDELRQELATVQRQCDRADEEIGGLRAQLESAFAELAAVTRRAEALTRQAQRREEELRQSRQAGRAASQSQLRQARIDGLRALATVLAEVADQAIHATEESASARVLYRRVLAQAAAAGLVDFGTAGEEVDFDPVRHQALTDPAARVVVERPGFAWQAGGTLEEVVLVPALVRLADQ
ncbi:hypothetical protein ABZ468_20140 [Streptomyces sp. NPDC005708]|uniref:hypothetical protein n=1 Tax=Streptomyces sp. NPDC005708 TaxID=3154564 RepID=UPI0033E70C03